MDTVCLLLLLMEKDSLPEEEIQEQKTTLFQQLKNPAFEKGFNRLILENPNCDVLASFCLISKKQETIANLLSRSDTKGLMFYREHKGKGKYFLVKGERKLLGCFV